MFRVPENTVMRRAAVTTMILLSSTTFAACGGLDAPEDQASATSGTTAAESAPAATSTTPVDSGTSNNTAPRADGLQVEKSSKSSDTPETKATIAKAKKRKKPADDATLKAQSEKVLAALQSDGFNATSLPPYSAAKYAVQIGTTSMLFYVSPAVAAEDASVYERLIKTRPGYGRTARDGNRVYLLNSREKLTDEQIDTFRDIRAVAEGAL